VVIGTLQGGTEDGQRVHQQHGDGFSRNEGREEGRIRPGFGGERMNHDGLLKEEEKMVAARRIKDVSFLNFLL
jgi:hypothetical protein